MNKKAKAVNIPSLRRLTEEFTAEVITIKLNAITAQANF